MYKSLGESRRYGTLKSQQIPSGINIEHFFLGLGLTSITTNHTSQSDMKDVESVLILRTPMVVSFPMMEGHIAYQHQYYLSKANIGAPIVVFLSKHKKQVSQFIPWHVDITQA